MKIAREWATPLTIGSFGLIAVTGVLMFFHLDSGLNKAAHEWLSWLLLAGVALHAAANWLGFKRYFQQRWGRSLLALAALVLGLSFLPVGGGGEPPFMVPVKALAAAPVSVLAQVGGVSIDQMQQRLQAAGAPGKDGTDSVALRVGPDLRRQMQVLKQVLDPVAAPVAGLVQPLVSLSGVKSPSGLRQP